MNVYITVDTEVWPRHGNWRESSLREDLQRDIYGMTPSGPFGVIHQMEELERHGLKAVFFVEALFVQAVGLEPLQRLVGQIQDRGHDVQLHLHSEWLRWIDPPLLSGRTGGNMHDFSEDEQTALLEMGRDNLTRAGARDVCAFRAGNYGANFDTLRALARSGLRYDSSHNACYLESACRMKTTEPILQPVELHGVIEYPVSYFQDWPGHRRHAQLCACSATELTGALMEAWGAGWESFVIVSHSFELLRRRKQSARPPLPDRAVIARFRRLCEFLSVHRDKFRTATFSERPSLPEPHPAVRPLRSKLRWTARRCGEQLLRRLVSAN